MAKKIFYAIMMIAAAALFASCEKDVYADAWDNGGTPTPDLDTYELITEHVGFAIEGDILLDDHDAVLLKNGEEVERHAYAGEFALSHNQVVLKRSIAEKLQNSTISYVDGKFDLAGVAVLTVSSQLQSCDEVYCTENGKTYCHPQFAEQNKGGVAALNLCSPQPDFLVLHAINGDILNGDVYFDDQKWLAEIIVIEDDVLGWEVDDYATVTDRNTVSINAYETRNGIRTGRVETLTAGYSANLVAGTIEPKTSQDILRLISTTATMSGSKAYFNYTLGSENFQGEWSWSASSNATFTLPDGQQVEKPIKAEYSVRSTDLSINGNIYSNAASLYAGTVEVAEDVQKIQVSRPDIEGYEAISGFLTRWYRNINETLVSQGNIIVVNYRNINDKNKNILVVRDASNGQEVMRENANNIAAETILSVVYGNNGMAVATLIGVTSTNNQPKDWRYEAINSEVALTVDEMAVVTQRLPNPYIAYATVENGGLKLGNFIFY